MPPLPVLNPVRLAILELIEKHRLLPTGQIHLEVQPEKHRRQTVRDLEALENLGLVRHYRLYPELGQASEFGWQIRRAGAEQLKVPHGSHHFRHHGREWLENKRLSLELARRIREADWGVIEPASALPAGNKPTPQAEALKCYFPHHAQISPRANDFLAFYPPSNLLVLMVLSPTQSSLRFWQSRLDQYSPLLPDLLLVAVFKDLAQANPHLTRLKTAGCRIILLENASLFLASVADS